jgi:anti-sigma factor RsiW
MKDGHPAREILIDLVEGAADLAADRIVALEAHLAGCRECRAYVESLRRAVDILAADEVPEPAGAFFECLAGTARRRASGRVRPMVLRFVPGLAGAAAAIVLVVWLAGGAGPSVSGLEIIMTEMTTGEIMETVIADPHAGGAVIGSSESGLIEVERYLEHTESIYDLLEAMSDAEKARFTAYVEQSMGEERRTSGLPDGSVGKEC